MNITGIGQRIDQFASPWSVSACTGMTA